MIVLLDRHNEISGIGKTRKDATENAQLNRKLEDVRDWETIDQLTEYLEGAIQDYSFKGLELFSNDDLQMLIEDNHLVGDILELLDDTLENALQEDFESDTSYEEDILNMLKKYTIVSSVLNGDYNLSDLYNDWCNDLSDLEKLEKLIDYDRDLVIETLGGLI